jgi:signal transduction histidine kinase
MLGWSVLGLVFGGFCLSTIYLYVQAVNHQTEQLHRHVRDLAEVAAAVVDVNQHKLLEVPAQTGSPPFQKVLEPLAAFHRRHPNIGYVYTIRESADGRHYVVVDTRQDPEVRKLQKGNGRSEVPTPMLTEYHAPKESAAADAVLRQGKTFVFTQPYTDQFGTFVEARAPLLLKDGEYRGYAVVDYDLDRFNQQINTVRQAGLVTVGLALLLSIVLSRTAAKVRQGELDNIRAAGEQRDLAAKANRAKSELLAIASHDLKNPLSAIAGMSGLMLQMKRVEAHRPETKDEIETLESIHASAQHMSEIVRGLLVTEGIEQGGLPFQPAQTNIGPLCADIIRFNAPAASRKAIAVRAEIAPGLLASADPKLLREAFDNYVSNAIKYSPKGSTILISLCIVPETDEIEFAVTDHGLGLTAADQLRAFGKFQKLSARPTGGETSTGLGLSIVKRVAELHHGRVGCDSEPGKGARFWLRIPRGSPPIKT